jgi:hypothetical protein
MPAFPAATIKITALLARMSPVLGTALDRFQEAQDSIGGDVGPLRLRVMPGPGTMTT